MSIWQGVRDKIFNLLAGIAKSPGGQLQLPVIDYETRSLLHQILEEIQIMNVHLQSITDEKVDKGDVK